MFRKIYCYRKNIAEAIRNLFLPVSNSGEET